MAITTVQGQMLTAPLTLTGNLAFSDGSVQTAAASPYVLKNRIINGDMRIDQRNAGASVTPTTGQFTLDRWVFFVSQTSKLTTQQNQGSVTPPVGFTNYLGATSSSAYSVISTDLFIVAQPIEGFNLADLSYGTASAKTITLSFWVRSSLTGTFGGSLFNSNANKSYTYSYTISSANTWEQKSITIPGDTVTVMATNNAAGLSTYFNLGAGSNWQTAAGSWTTGNYSTPPGTVNVVGTNGATFYLTGVQLEIGTTATPFERRLYNQELANCQRYYQRTGGYFAATVVANQLDAVGSYSQWVPMRAAPTVSLPAGADFHRPGVAFYAASAITTSQDANGVGYTSTTIASGAGGGTSGQMRAGVILSAEL